MEKNLKTLSLSEKECDLKKRNILKYLILLQADKHEKYFILKEYYSNVYDYSDCDLTGLHLDRANFDSIDFKYTKFVDCFVHDTIFINTILDETDFTNTAANGLMPEQLISAQSINGIFAKDICTQKVILSVFRQKEIQKTNFLNLALNSFKNIKPFITVFLNKRSNQLSTLGEQHMEKQEQTTQQSKLLAKSPLAGSVVNLNEQIKALTQELGQIIHDIAEQPVKYELEQDGLCHVLVKALRDKTDDVLLRKQLQNFNLIDYLGTQDNRYGFSPLHWLALRDDIHITNNLLKSGFSMEGNKLGLLPTHLAACFGKNKFLLHRLEKVTKFNQVEIKFIDDTQTPSQTLKFVLNELHLAIMGRQLELIQGIFNTFTQKHALINSDISTIGNLLHLIVYVSCHESPERKSDSVVSAVELLQTVILNFTADHLIELLRQKENNHEGLTPLMLAAKYGQVSLFRELLTYLQLHVEHSNGLQEINRAFCCAAEHGQIKVIELLLHYYRFRPNTKLAEYKATNDFLREKKKDTAKESTPFRAIANMMDNADDEDNSNDYVKPSAKTQAYKNLVLSGGGGKGFALPYLLQAFKQHTQYRSEQEFNPLEQEILSYAALQRVGGTSAGAIFAMALAVGHSPEDIITNYYDYDFSEFLETERIQAMVKEMDAQSPNKLSILNKLLDEMQVNLQKTKELLKKTQGHHPVMGAGLYALTHPKALYQEIKSAINTLKDLDKSFQGFTMGAKVLAFIKRLLTDKGLREDLTFGELARLVSQDNKRYKHLHVVVTNLSKGTFEVLSSENSVYKNYLVIDAVRASMSYPVVFAPHHLRFKENGSLKVLQDEYIDGGVLRNFAIDEFDFKRYTHTDWVGDPRYPELNKETLGFRFEVKEAEVDAAMQASAPTDVLGRVKALVSLYAEAESLISAYVDREYGRSIAIDTSPITTFTFKRLDEHDKAQLKQKADQVVAAYFKQELPKESSLIEELPNSAPAKGTYQIQPVPGVHYFQSNNININQSQVDNDNTNAWTNYSASSIDTQLYQNPSPK